MVDVMVKSTLVIGILNGFIEVCEPFAAVEKMY